MAAKRLTRKEIIQEDVIHSTLSAVYDWGATHRGLLLSLLGGLVLVIAVSYVWGSIRTRRWESRQREFAEALEIYHSPVGEASQEKPAQGAPPPRHRFESRQEMLESALASFTRVSEEYPSSQVGLLSKYYQGLIQHQLGREQKARASLQAVIEKAEQVEVADLARQLLAEISLEKDPAAAAALLEKIVAHDTSALPKDAILVELGRSYEAAGQPEKALDAYRRVTSEFPSSNYVRDARVRMTALEATHPASDEKASAQASPASVSQN